MRSIFMMTDLEGVAGVASFDRQTYQDSKYYDHVQRLLTAEINAAVDGLIDAEVEEIFVLDGHGPGAVWYSDLKAPAKLIHGRPIQHAQWKPLLAKCDAAMFLGQHAMAGVATSSLNHTFNSRAVDVMKLNGQPIGEIAAFSLFAGGLGVPIICLTGEHDACEEAKATVPGVQTVCVKWGLSRTSCVSLAASASHKLLREGVRHAVDAHRKSPIKPLVWPGPFTLDIRYFSSDLADNDCKQTTVQRIDSQTTRRRGETIYDVIYRW